MSDGEGCVAAGIAIGLVLGFIAGIVVAAWVSQSWRNEAVEKGHAEYVLKGSEAVWQWKQLDKERK